MFYGLWSVVDLDVTNFNTKNSKSFNHMFCEMNELKKIDVSKFNTSKCENIKAMLCCCTQLTERDMFDWDISNLNYNYGKENPINSLFSNCKNLKKIKISGNLRREEAEKDFKGDMFEGIPEIGTLVLNNKLKNNIPLNKCLPENWAKSYE